MENISTTPNCKAHRELLTSRGVDFDRLVEWRKDIHKNAEGGFQEYNTQKKVIEQFQGLEDGWVRACAGTGVIVDIIGTAKASEEGECSCIAFRVDMDALLMKEETDLEYSSVTEYAHMCGHDGHMATLLAAAQFWIKSRHKIPKNKTIRLLFQPAEELAAGAQKMIKEGWLDGVDEVYGYHTAPFGDEGSVSIKANEFMAGNVIVEIYIEGVGGHGSEPALSTDPITAAVMLHNSFQTIKSRSLMNTDVASFNIGWIQAGSTFNVIPRTAKMLGTLRYYKEEVKDKVIGRIQTLTKSICEANGCRFNCIVTPICPPVINHEKHTKIFIDIAKEEIGENNVNLDNQIPWSASEDFSYFLQKVPGCFIALNNVKVGEEPISLHSSKMNFNDNTMATGALLNIRLSEHRLGIKII